MAADVTILRGDGVHPTPRVSVIVPCYASRTLAEALASVRAQTFTAWELVVVDDGSPSHPPEPADDVVLVRQPNGGPGLARNTGLAQAAGELVAFLDSDDRWRPDKLERQVAAHEAHPDWIMSATDAVAVQPDGTLIERFGPRYGVAGEGIPFAQLVYENCVTTSTVMARRDAVARTPGFDPRREIAEDYALWLRLAVLGPVGYVDAVLTEHVDHEGSITELLHRSDAGHTQEMATYAEFLAEHPELAAEPYVRAGLARAHFDHGYGCLRRGDWGAARAAFAESWRHHPSARAGRGWLRAALHVGGG